ncbi:MAG: ribosome silencing factor [bacterium]
MANYTLDKKAEHLVIYDLKDISSFTDYFLICSGTTFVQVKAIADYIEEKMREQKVKLDHMEGYREGKWVLMDYGDVVIHIFDPASREFYDLERLWGDAPTVDLKEEVEKIRS